MREHAIFNFDIKATYFHRNMTPTPALYRAQSHHFRGLCGLFLLVISALLLLMGVQSLPSSQPIQSTVTHVATSANSVTALTHPSAHTPHSGMQNPICHSSDTSSISCLMQCMCLCLGHVLWGAVIVLSVLNTLTGRYCQFSVPFRSLILPLSVPPPKPVL